MFHPERPDLDHIELPPGIGEIEERIVLAHELGHAENSRNERDRWMELIPELESWYVFGRRPKNIKVILDEEKRANARGRFHISELHPELLGYYDDQMEGALEAAERRLENLW